jgi:hypothetical protein
MFEAIEAIGRIVEGFFGLRFLVSSSYRARTRNRWMRTSGINIFLECFGAVIGLALILLLGYSGLSK